MYLTTITQLRCIIARLMVFTSDNTFRKIEHRIERLAFINYIKCDNTNDCKGCTEIICDASIKNVRIHCQENVAATDYNGRSICAPNVIFRI